MVLVYVESPGGLFKKAAYEVVTYGAQTAAALGTSCVALVIGESQNPAELGLYGASKVLHVQDIGLQHFDSQTHAAAIAQVAKQIGASTVVLSHSANGKALVGRLAIKLDAGSVSGVNAVPTVNDGALSVTKSVFSGKAFATYALTSAHKVISVMGNSLAPEASGTAAPVEALSVDIPASRVRVLEVHKQTGGVAPLPEAELVVSAGRGLKGPENWGMIEELAGVLGATTACSRPVADMHWRPHHEHVGQTGLAIRPNLYIAVGISGAIQHLAGVNSSKCIVVINRDAEAPFFKAAHYGIVGDAFEVVPRLIEALKAFKAQN